MNVDLYLLMIGAPAAMVLGAPVAGVLIGTATWVALRVLGHAVARYIDATHDLRRQMALGLCLRLTRLAGLTAATLSARAADGRSGALVAVAIMTTAFTARNVATVLTGRALRRRSSVAGAHG